MCPNIPSSAKRTETASSVPQDDANKARAMTMDSASSLNLQECSALDLAEYLTQQRFSGSASKSVEFLQHAIEALQSTGGNPAAVSPQATTSSMDLGDPLLVSPLETSLLNPRGGKCSIQLYANGYLVATQLKTPSVQLVLPASAISHVVLFAKAEDYKLLQSNSPTKKKPNPHLVLLKLHDTANVEFQNKKVQGQICFALSWVKGVGPTGPTTPNTNEPTVDSGWKDATQAWRNVLGTCLGGSHNPTLEIVQVQPQHQASAPFFSFQTPGQSTTTGDMPFVKCYQGVQDGVLYPLREGLLFYKPPRFLPRSELVSIACGRGSGGGQSSSRYVDMIVQLQQDDTTVEFTNIQREELGVLNEYIHQVLIPAMQADAKKEGTTGTSPMENNAQGGDDDDSTEDEGNSEMEDEDSDDEDENFLDGDEEEDEGEAGSNEEGDDDDEQSEDEEDDDFEVVDDDFAKELSKRAKGKASHDEPRASRSSKRKGSPIVQEVAEIAEDNASVAGDDDDFEVVQAASSTESEGDDDSASGSPTKKSRH